MHAREPAGRVGAVRAAALLAAALTVVLLGGCGASGTWTPRAPTASTAAPPPGSPSAPASPPGASVRVLTFVVVGSGRASSITYEVDGAGTTVTAPPLPWTRTFALPAGRGHTWRMVLRTSGAVQSRVLVDGAVLTEGSSDGPNGEATMDGSFE